MLTALRLSVRFFVAFIANLITRKRQNRAKRVALVGMRRVWRFGAVAFTPAQKLTHLLTLFRFYFVARTATLLVALSGAVFAFGQTAHFVSGIEKIGSGFSEPLHMAVDASGDLFVSDADSIAIFEIVAVDGVIPSSPTIRTLYRPSANPQGIAVDAQGNVYFTTLDVYSNLGNNSVTELVAVNGVIPPSPVVRQLGSGLYYPNTIAVDLFGDIFVSDSFHSLVKEFVAVNGSVPSSPTILTLGSGFSDPRGIAVDGSGNVYVSDFGNKQIKEILAVNGSIPASPAIVTLGSGFCGPGDIALDASGDLYLADYCNAAIFELPSVNGVIQPNTASIQVVNKINGIEGVAVSPFGTLYAGSVESAITAIAPPLGSFGSVKVGSTSSSIPLAFAFDSGGELGAISVLTAGATGLDFANAGSGTCVPNATYAAGQSCTVNVTFTPKFAGVRNGAVELNDANGNAMATAYLQGTGIGPQLSFSPGAQTTLGSSFQFAAGVAVDGAGNAYVTDLINNLGNIQQIVAVNGQIPANPTVRTLVGGLDCPAGLTLDAAGDLYFVDGCYHTVNEIHAVNGSIPSSPSISMLTSQFGAPAGIAVDGSGNVYVLDESNNTVNEIHAVNGVIPASPTITTLASGFKEVDGIAVDGGGNVYVSDDTSREVFEVHAVNGSIPASPVVSSLGSGFAIPRGIAVDAAGNVYVADYYYNSVFELLAVNGSVPASPAIRTLANGLVYANGVAVDANRNVFVADYGDARLVRLDYADPPSLSFASTSVGSTSADSPQTVTVTNVGNADLTFPVPSTGTNPNVGADFSLDANAAGACPVVSSSSYAAALLAAGTSCSLSVSFTPAMAGTESESLTLTDSNLNAAAPAYTSQSISLAGTAVPATPSIAWANPSTITYGTALSAAQLNATASVPGTFSYSPAAGTVLSAGQTRLTVTFTPTDTKDYTTATATVTLTVAQATPTIVWSTPAAIAYGTALSTTQLDATSTVAGTFSYSPAAGTVLSVGQYTLSTTFTPTDSVDYTTATATVTLAVAQPAPVEIDFVQAASRDTTATSSSLSLPFTTNTLAGDLILVGFDFVSGVAPSSVTDSQGNTFTAVGNQLTTPGGASSRVYFAQNIKGGADTITIKLSSSSSWIEAYVTEYSGASTVSPIDAQAGASGNAGAVSSGSAATSGAGDKIYGYCVADWACTVGTGFTARSTFNNNLIEDITAASAGSFAAAASASNGWSMQMVAIKPAMGTIIQPPAITSATTANGVVGSGFSYQITASNSPTSYNATGLPSGLTVDTSTGLISGTPTVAGTSSVTLSATNGTGTGTASLTLTIVVPKPTITSGTTANGVVGSAFSYQITASNSPTSYNATGLPSGLTVDTSTGLISGTPTAAGSSSITLSATNGTGTGTASLTLTIVVPKPTITSGTTANGVVGSAFSYQITASNSPTSYGATGLPSGLTVDTSTGLISGTPTVAGTSSVTLSAANGTGAGTASLTLTIAVPKPTITSGLTANGVIGSGFSYQITASNSPTSYNATGLPSGLTVNTSTGVISGTPTVAGTSSVTLSATNGTGTGTATLALTVSAVAPGVSFVQLASKDTTATSSSLSLPFTTNTLAGDLILVGFDFVSGVAPSSVTDSQGNTFTAVGNQLTTPGGASSRVYFAQNIKGGADTITIKLSSSSSWIEAYVTEYSGASTVSPIDAQAGASGNAGAVSSGIAATSEAGDKIYGYCVADWTCTAATGFAARSTFNNNLIEDITAASVGSFAATASASNGWSMQMVAIKP